MSALEPDRMPSNTTQNPLGEIPQAYFELVRAQMRWGQEMLEAVTNTRFPAMGDPVAQLRRALPRPVCHVPPPCWMPKPLGECTSHVNPCGKASIRLVVTNCDRVHRDVHVRVEGVEGAEVHPSSLHLGPMQRSSVRVTLAVPEDAGIGSSQEALIWVDGCRQHFLRWTVSVGSAGLDSCHEIAVDDCPDHRHHWYDHFYCQRPCPSPRSTQSG
jgi:hypothetical protein